MEITYSGFAQGHTKKAKSIFGIVLPRVKVLSHHLPGGPVKEQKALRQDLPGFELGTSKCKSMYVELSQNAQ
jgi:hypothetical protein